MAVSATVLALCLLFLGGLGRDRNILKAKEARFFLFLAGFSSAFTYELVGQSLPEGRKRLQNRRKSNSHKGNQENLSSSKKGLLPRDKATSLRLHKKTNKNNRNILYLLIVIASGFSLHLATSPRNLIFSGNQHKSIMTGDIEDLLERSVDNWLEELSLPQQEPQNIQPEPQYPPEINSPLQKSPQYQENLLNWPESTQTSPQNIKVSPSPESPSLDEPKTSTETLPNRVVESQTVEENLDIGPRIPSLQENQQFLNEPVEPTDHIYQFFENELAGGWVDFDDSSGVVFQAFESLAEQQLLMNSPRVNVFQYSIAGVPLLEFSDSVAFLPGNTVTVVSEVNETQHIIGIESVSSSQGEKLEIDLRDSLIESVFEAAARYNPPAQEGINTNNELVTDDAIPGEPISPLQRRGTGAGSR
ncbi:hypothetical protein IQ254_30735 [Nodosilinea sp. LEGE 07088]|uniref:hypothetical protein n=1 Tax=Nodosilinea sp. LEGE 07088 TaxID=2777968 RepID=UPI001880396B|nr:hypothetical protein [Nodosilinea sp. LEGE 07088]MBE9141515.1 hypothetical protein [Nodosilinea sp. LEGE 07088]